MNVSCCECILALSVLALPFLYEFSQSFRYHFKFLVYYCLLMFFCTICIPLYLFRPGNMLNFLIGAFLCKYISPIIGIKWIFRGKENFTKDRSGIIVSNHQSSIDVLGLFEIWPVIRKCTAIGKKELLYSGPFGIASWLCGLIFIDRVNSDSARNTVNEAAKFIKKEEAKVWIFAEGTRRNTGEIHPFKKGAFHMAINAQIPIIPVVFSRYYFLDKNEKRFDNGNIIGTCLPSISTEGMTIEDVDKLMKQTREVMIKQFDESSKEVLEISGIKSVAAS